MNKKAIILWIFCLATLLWLIYFIFYPNQKVYYISDVKMYIKLSKRNFTKYGYVYISQEKSFSKTNDYLKVLSYATPAIIINPKNPNNLYLLDYSCGIPYIHRKTLSMQDFYHRSDTIFFEKKKGTEPNILKKPFVEISIGINLENVFYKKSGEKAFTKIEEL